MRASACLTRKLLTSKFFSARHAHGPVSHINTILYWQETCRTLGVTSVEYQDPLIIRPLYIGTADFHLYLVLVWFDLQHAKVQ